MNYIDLKFVNLLSTRLERFSVKQTNPYRVNCRCPICGDSQKSKTKARGWFLEKDNSALYYCHNCAASMSLRNFLKFIDTNLYNDYIIDTSLDKNVKRVETKPLDKLKQSPPPFRRSGSQLLQIPKISQLNVTHKARKYVDNRRIPVSKHYKLYYASKFNEWVNSIIPDKLPKDRDEPRLVLPFIDDKGKMFGFQGRAFGSNSLRYITIMIDEDAPKVFGLDDIDFDQVYYVTEGPIDSLFLDNALAMAGADSNVMGLRNLENCVFVFDNEPRNKDIVSRMSRCIEDGYKVCIWPKNVVDKDINDMLLSGLSSADIKLIIDQNTQSGLTGRLALSYWRKC